MSNYETIKNTNHNEIFKHKNVVIIILESFSKEYVGYYNNGKGYTPFLDSLINYSLVMERAYANGIKSIEALPSIVSSIPTLMNNPFITSIYATNKYYSLPLLLKREGYSTSFFHGGNRGTMGFYSLVRNQVSKNILEEKTMIMIKIMMDLGVFMTEHFLNIFLSILITKTNPF